MSFDQQTQFGNPDDLFGTVHPYFTPTGFTFLTAGLKHRFWVSDHSFRGANEHWYSIYGGARVDSDAEGYALVELAAHCDWCGWLTAHADASAIFSDVYQGIAFSGFLTIRFP